jgi:hypothetical protein
LTQNNEWIIMVNVPDFGAAGPGAGAGGYAGNGFDLFLSFTNAIQTAINPTLPGYIPAHIPPLLPGALPAGARIAANGMPPPPAHIAIPFIGGNNQRGWTHALGSQIIIDAIWGMFFDPAFAGRAANCAAITGISIIIPKSQRIGPAQSRAALTVDWM